MAYAVLIRGLQVAEEAGGGGMEGAASPAQVARLEELLEQALDTTVGPSKRI